MQGINAEPLTTDIKKLNFRMRFKYGLKAQKFLAQGVWGKTYESSIKKRYKTAATEGEEW